MEDITSTNTPLAIPLVLDGTSLARAQKCPRIWVHEREAQGAPKWNPKALFDKLLREAYIRLGESGDPEKEAVLAEAEFRENSRHPGLDTLSNSWVLAGDFCSMFGTILEGLSRRAIPEMKIFPKVIPVGPQVWWRISSPTVPENVLERIITVEKYSESSLYRETRSWTTFGDMAATGLGTHLTFIEIGSLGNSRRCSNWCRTFEHPSLKRYFRFRARNGRNLGPNWRAKFLSDDTVITAKEWVNLMETDKLKLFHEVWLDPLSEAHRLTFRAQVASEAARLQGLPGDFNLVPMTRGACDWPSVCPWQFKCFGKD